ncbi:hypothetical protein ACIA6C_28310 [Streptomyces sp. NPDC051578]|uniref:hypothetical protein n=1 Tax=Streptomyces sp. NPDC051578 TaxID=3365662 RepID=UPI0037ABEB30
MSLTPRPIKCNTSSVASRSPIGTRYTDGDETYTLVAYRYDDANPKLAIPILVGDSDFDDKEPNWFETLTHGSITLEVPSSVLAAEDILEIAEADEELSARARAAAFKRYNEPARDTSDWVSVLAFEDIETDEELAAFHRWVKTELALREAQAALARAAEERGYAIGELVALRGSQEKAARLIGLNQSSVNRAMRQPRD